MTANTEIGKAKKTQIKITFNIENADGKKASIEFSSFDIEERERFFKYDSTHAWYFLIHAGNNNTYTYHNPKSIGLCAFDKGLITTI